MFVLLLPYKSNKREEERCEAGNLEKEEEKGFGWLKGGFKLG